MPTATAEIEVGDKIKGSCPSCHGKVIADGEQGNYFACCTNCGQCFSHAPTLSEVVTKFRKGKFK